MTTWSTPGDDLRPDAAQVHVWRACLDQTSGQVKVLSQTLSADECARAARFRTEQQQHRFISARGTLRTLVGRYLSCDPDQVQLGADEHGRPCLAGALSFNLSHAGSMGLFAFALDRKIGIDVESTTRQVAADRIAGRFLAESEASRLRSLQPDQVRHRAFLRCWTHKEAYLKATGEGISAGALSRFEVSVDPQLPACVERVEGAPDEAERWRLEDLPLDDSDFVGAVCVEGHDWRLRCLQYA